MIITHCYKIKPTPGQSAKIDYWLELLRRHWNYARLSKVGLVKQNQVSNRPMLSSVMSYWRDSRATRLLFSAIST
ncbi:MAG: helix-turn-helix domain-containing protein [Microcoleaceae cyanobacterium]